MLEEELKKHSSKKPKQSRGSDIAYRASVPAPPIAPVRQSQRLMSKSNNTATAAGMCRTNKRVKLTGSVLSEYNTYVINWFQYATGICRELLVTVKWRWNKHIWIIIFLGYDLWCNFLKYNWCTACTGPVE